MVEMRHYYNTYPELSFEETKTAQYVQNFYEGKDYDIRTNVGGHGIVVIIERWKTWEDNFNTRRF